MGVVEVVALDESLLLAFNGDGNAHLTPSAATLLRRLQYSKLRVVVCYHTGISSEKVILLRSLMSEYCMECMSYKASSLDGDDAFSRLLPSWSCSGGLHIYATSVENEDLFLKLSNEGWKIILKSSKVDSANDKGVLFITELEQLLFTLCDFNKMNEMHNVSNVTIGYIMKPSRELDFLKRGAFPMNPTQNGLIFVPLTFELPLSWQLKKVNAVLHKATDEIISIDPSRVLEFPKGITFSKGMQETERYFQEHPECCIIDPLDSIYPMLDRLRIQEILLGLQTIKSENGPRIRGPQYLKVDDFHERELNDRLLEAKLSFPNIIKPQVACGVSDAHNMAMVFEAEHFKDLGVPLPAIVQEYVNHGSMLYKFYVLGKKVFYAVKKSMPNADALKLISEKNGCSPINFDSLKSLPTADVDLSCDGASQGRQSLDEQLVTDAVDWLRKKLDLTIFGFDVVIQEGSGDHVIVDLNYLPSFKDVPDNDAMPAFWDAIESSYESWKERR